jgi:putative N-acetyltransferase (TIGR04045 family)
VTVARRRRPRPALDVRVAVTPEDLEAHFAVRRAVFCDEQGIFEGSDRDAWDDVAIHVVASHEGAVVGAVRLYELDKPGLWKGDRLAVLHDARRLGAGAPLVRFAVATAGERGGYRMIAQIQERNVAFFAHLGWTAVGVPEEYRSLTHQLMEIRLSGAVEPARDWVLTLAGDPIRPSA